MVGVVPSLPMAHTSDDDPQRFDFSAHRMCEQRYFEDFRLNERFILPSRTMTDAMFAAFQLASATTTRSTTTSNTAAGWACRRCWRMVSRC